MKATIRLLALSTMAAGLVACSVQRSQVASDAKSKLVDMSTESILACMGPPLRKAQEGSTEVWMYKSGLSVSNYTTVTPYNSFTDTTVRECTANVVFSSGRVTAINYSGKTGGLVNPLEECYEIVASCMKR